MLFQRPFVALDVPHGAFLLSVEGRVVGRARQFHHVVFFEQLLHFLVVEDRASVMLEHQRRAVPVNRFFQVISDIGRIGWSRCQPPVDLVPRTLVLQNEQFLLASPLLEGSAVFRPHRHGGRNLVFLRFRDLLRGGDEIGDHPGNRAGAPGAEPLPDRPALQHSGAPLPEVVQVAPADLPP